ncbi:hypothetical protein [Emticicia sp. TH156]|uniref:hypothetical protein n=1 Tax=Emticicia sp. TH156 TaxID=2067454 RepID=UPI000C7875BB|nr:hypothetical protein [Emticicia sp. TH156]PLK46266.1 hypothetical protein C0V77_02665 [Emticicia sp. TH156]
MKKLIILFIAGVLTVIPEFSQATSAATPSTVNVKEELGKGRRKKSGRYKKKKGFMWGLFKSKNQCDCPRH